MTRATQQEELDFMQDWQVWDVLGVPVAESWSVARHHFKASGSTPTMATSRSLWFAACKHDTAARAFNTRKHSLACGSRS